MSQCKISTNDRHNWKRLASFRCDESRQLITAYLLSGMEKNALLLVVLYANLYISQEREPFFLSISRGSREPITIDKLALAHAFFMP